MGLARMFLSQFGNLSPSGVAEKVLEVSSLALRESFAYRIEHGIFQFGNVLGSVSGELVLIGYPEYRR